MSIVSKVFALGLLSGSLPALAAQLCMEVPEGVTYDSLTTNFDGGLTVTNPKVSVGGEYLPVATPAPMQYAGVCRIFGRDPQAHKGHQQRVTRVAHLNWDGTLINTYEAVVADVIKYVHCAPVKQEE